MEFLILMMMCREDLETHEISGSGLVLLALASILRGLTAETTASESLLCFVPAVILWILHCVSRGQIGIGDVYLFWALGFARDPGMMIGAFCDSFILAGVYSLGRMILGNAREIAFLPFVMIAVGGEFVARCICWINNAG